MTISFDDSRQIIDYMNEKAPILFLILSEKGDIVLANQYAETLTGKPLTYTHIQDLVLDFKSNFDLSLVIEKPSKEYLFSIKTASGLPQSFYFSFMPTNNQILVFGRLDTDEIEAMRKEVLALNQELNNLTRELHKKNAQLYRLNEEKNRFLGMAAHDLRKPIGLVMSYSEFLLDEAAEALDSEHTGFLNTINASCTFMKRLVDDFLDVSAIEAGKFDLDLQLTNISNVLEKSLELNNLQAVKKGVALEVRCDKNLLPIPMDASKIEQVITNLVSNAIEHTPPETKVRISLSQETQCLFFSVQDEGLGIPTEEREKIFKPFEKTSVKKTGGEKSTGLGMLITRKIIEAHEGEVWVADTPPGQGAKMSFKIPLKVVSE